MKLNKFLCLGLMGAACCFASACSDDGSTKTVCDENGENCKEVAEECEPLTMTKLHNQLKEAANVEIVAVEDITAENAAEVAAACNTLTANLSTFASDSGVSTVTSASFSAELTQGGTLCKINKAANFAIDVLTVTSTYNDVKAKVETCTTIYASVISLLGAEEGAKYQESQTNLQTSFTTVDGWHNILQTAANATASSGN